MTDPQDKPDEMWDKGWHGHEKSQLLRISRLSLSEKIKWLEEAQEMIGRIRKKDTSIQE